MENLYQYEHSLFQKGYQFICGVDEVGRGPLAGPVVAGAVILPKGFYLKGLNDSKKLSPKQRETFCEYIKENAIAFATAYIYQEEIDEINIYQASKKAMIIAIQKLKTKPDYVLIDAMPINELNIDNESIIKGDSKSISIAAASVIAKVERDNYMMKLSKIYPIYKFDKHKGYPTKEHIEIIKNNGITEHHRKTFQPIKGLLIKK